MSHFRRVLSRAIAIPLLALASVSLNAQSDRLRSGPMVCYSEMKEVMLWVQTWRPSRTRIIYWDQKSPGKRYATREVTTLEENSCVAHLVADSLTPGARYSYELQIDGSPIDRPYPLEFQSQRLWQWRGDPPSFTVALGSCAYVNEPEVDRPGEPYGKGSGIFRSIYQKRPDAMLWLGDNIYLREVDWYSWTGILHRYTHSRSIAELQPLLGSTHHYAIWDDHDYGPNDADRSFRGKEQTLAAFKLFWGNPTYGTATMPGVMTSFEWGDAEFFLLDDRYYRAPNRRSTGERPYLGAEQMQWLIDKLATSRATFKIIAVGGQVLNPVKKYENYANYAEERQELIDLISKEKIGGVLFLSGDRHHSELTSMPREGSYPLYDLTVSPLTSQSYLDTAEANTLRVPGSYIGVQNFALLNFSGGSKERTMTISIFDSDGKELWSKSIKAAELR